MKNNKQKSKGRFLCLLLALLMVFIDIPFTGSAGNLGAAEVKADTLQVGDAVTIRFKDPTGRKYYEYRFRESLCVTDRYELAGIGNPVYICIPYWTSEWRLWIFDSGRSFQFSCKCYLADLCELGC